jgi:hypothetical protein
MSGFLKVSGTKIVDQAGKPVVLKGTATGGHMNMENFINGYPGTEHEHKVALKKVMGEEKFNYFFDKFYEYFWTEEDAKFFKSLGLNCLRIPFNYRHFLDDDDLTIIKEDGFKLMDRIVDTCAKHGVYTVLDLHAVPGGQNQDWHCDGGTHHALFWRFGHFQDAIVNLWQKIAAHYKNNTWVAGYNPLNEPADSRHVRLVNFYTKVEKAIRAVDPNHILFLDANTYAMEFKEFPEKPFPNSVYAIHDYSRMGFPGHEQFEGKPDQLNQIKRQYNRKVEYMKSLNVPVWNGEFGPVYASEVRGDSDVEATNAKRYNLLKSQLAVYKSGDPSGDGSPISWSIWVYKDIGYQGLTYVSPKSKWFQVLGKWLQKKQKLGLDKWGRDTDPEIEKNVYEVVRKHFRDVIPEHLHNAIYPHIWKSDTYVDLVLRELLLSQYLTYEFAECFRGLSFEDLDELAASWKIENVEKRDTLNKYLSEY